MKLKRNTSERTFELFVLGFCRKVKRYWKLDSWEDDCRRRRRLVPNPYGSSHSEAVLKSAGSVQNDDEENQAPVEDAMTQAEEPLHSRLASLGFGHREVPFEVGEETESNTEEMEMEYATKNTSGAGGKKNIDF